MNILRQFDSQHVHVVNIHRRAGRRVTVHVVNIIRQDSNWETHVNIHANKRPPAIKNTGSTRLPKIMTIHTVFSWYKLYMYM